MAKEEMVVACTYCKAPLKVFASDVDRIVKCQNCKRFTKIHGKVQKRMELECPVCSTMWNLPLKLRGRIYTCWKCQSQTQLLEAAKLNIEELAFVEQVEQGTEETEIIITVSNRGTPAMLTSIQLAFENNGQDVSSFYQVMTATDNVSQVDYTGPIDLKCSIAIDGEAPTGPTILYLEITGQDSLDENPLTCQATIQWEVVPQRIFIIGTEHDNQEQAAKPFFVQMWACLGSGEVDPSYQGAHYIQFECLATESAFNFPPVLPERICIEFQDGAGVTGKDFTLYNAQESPKIVAWEDALGGPQGESEAIVLKTDELDGFDVVLTSPQMDFAPFQGCNEIRAVDKYGNLVTSFAQDVWVYPGSNNGEIFAPGLAHNIVPANAFNNGCADLTSLRLMYIAPSIKELPRQETLIVSYQEKEGSSDEFLIEPNPIDIEIAQGQLPEKVEQGRKSSFSLELQNLSSQDVLSVFQVDHHFFHDSGEIDRYYTLRWENEGIECAPGTKSVLTFGVEVSEDAPIGIHRVEFTVYVQDVSDRFYGKRQIGLQWQVEPSGRVFRLLSPDPLNVEAGSKFALEVGAYFQGEPDENYSGERILHFQSDAKESANGTKPEIPEQLEVTFADGRAKTSEEFSFSNAEESPVLQVIDPAPGGARSEQVTFSVMPSDLDSFLVSLCQEELTNGEVFGELNQAIARDAYGNLKVDFAKDCTISPSSQRGKIIIDGKEETIIPASAFQGGIADFGELKIAYRNDVQDKLPREESFSVRCGDKTGCSKVLIVQPSPAKIHIARCSVPEELERGNEDHPIYIELENIGDIPASISSVLFSFHQDGDVSSNYTLLASPANTSNLVPGVPLQLSYTVKVSSKTPIGLTRVEVKVTGIETETNAPLQAKTVFEWTVEGGVRSFLIATGHDQREQAGAAFNVKIEAQVNGARDTRYNGEKTVRFEAATTPSPNGKQASIPERLTLNFLHGEAVSPSCFKLVNTGEMPVLRVLDTASKTEGKTDPIEAIPGPLEGFLYKLKSSVKEKQPLDGRNTITAIDAFGNIIKEFDEKVEIGVLGAKACLVDTQGREIYELPGDWFRKGTVNLSEHKLAFVCDSTESLPAQITLSTCYANKETSSDSLEIQPRPIKIILDQIKTDERVTQGENCEVHVAVINESDAKIEVENVIFSFSENGESYDFDFQEGDNPARLSSGKNTLDYLVALPKDAPCKKIVGKITIELTSREQGKMKLEGDFEWEIEPVGRSFEISTENHERQTAGIPFSLHIKTMLNGEQDTGLEGMRTLNFKSSATASPSGEANRVPKTLKVMFRQGEGSSERSFVLYNAGKEAYIEVNEKMAGGAAGKTPPITVDAGALETFKWALHSPQFNAATFEGENSVVAVDAYGNVKSDFQEDIRVQTQKGDIQVKEANLLNIVPGHVFEHGKADLTALEFCYQIAQTEYLPIQEKFIACYGDKKGESEQIRIQPRPLEFKIEEGTFSNKVFQGEEEKPLFISVRNTGDSAMEITEVEFRFQQDEEDISHLFTTKEKPENKLHLEPEKLSELNYCVEVSPEVMVGPVDLEICVYGKVANDEKSQQVAEAKFDIPFAILEKPRDFIITTENNNTEIAGEAFHIKIVVFKDGKQDRDYEGAHKIHFSIQEHEESRFLSYPKSENIEFTEGVGQSSQSFVLANAEQKPIIFAEEKEKARGNTQKILIKPGILHSLKVVFDEEKSGVNYDLHLLDKCDNVLQKDYKLDENLKPGVILTGTGGAFYEIQEIVGHGAMGKVYRGKRLNDNLTVAIKTMLFSALSDISRFLIEGHMLIRFQHPNIVKGYDLRQLCSQEGNKVESKFFMVMEYLPGQSVKDLMDTSPDGMLNYKKATEIIVQMAGALAYIWERNTIHRDIKPDNIQITEDGRVKMIDLGIARAEGGMVDISVTASDTVVGSYPYIAPERLKENVPIDYRSDAYSLGATYYHMLTGMPPFLDTYKGGGGRDLLEYLIRVRTKKMPTPPRKLVTDIPKSVSDAIMTMLRIKPTKRCETAEQLVELLKKVQKGL